MTHNFTATKISGEIAIKIVSKIALVYRSLVFIGSAGVIYIQSPLIFVRQKLADKYAHSSFELLLVRNCC